MYKPVLKDEIPPLVPRENSQKEWATYIINRFLASGDEAWEITKDNKGNPITRDTARLASVAIRNIAKRMNRNLDNEVIVALRSGKVYIYMEG